MAWMRGFYPAGPLVIARAHGAYLEDIDGHRYLDMNLADTSMATGYGVGSVADAVDQQFRLGAQTLMPTEQTCDLTEEMARRFTLPFWQFTLSASLANVEAMRIARAFTGRDLILAFDGKYHGMIDDTLHYLDEGQLRPEGAGLPADAGRNLQLIQYNDLDAAEAALSSGKFAALIIEPAITNVGGVIVPQPGYLASLRELASKYGTLLIIDEAHTHVCAYGGLTRAWQLQPDILVLGKALAGGIPIGAYGLTEKLRDFLEKGAGDDFEAWRQNVALGGTLYGNAVQIAAAYATLNNVLTPENHERVNRLGAHLADEIERIIDKLELPWSAYRLYCRSGWHPAPSLPQNNIEMAAVHDSEVKAAIHLYLANRGIWDAIDSASPAVSFAATREDVDRYVGSLGECLSELTG